MNTVIFCLPSFCVRNNFPCNDISSISMHAIHSLYNIIVLLANSSHNKLSSFCTGRKMKFSRITIIQCIAHWVLYLYSFMNTYIKLTTMTCTTCMHMHTCRTTQALTPVISAQICSTNNCPSQTNFTGEDYATLFFTTTRVNYLLIVTRILIAHLYTDNWSSEPSLCVLGWCSRQVVNTGGQYPHTSCTWGQRVQSVPISVLV